MDFKKRIAFVNLFGLIVVLSGCGPASAPSAVTNNLPTQFLEVQKPTDAPETMDTFVREQDGMSLVDVPACEFEMGSSDDERARPLHTVALDTFWIDQIEVTNAMFSDFLNQEGNQVEEVVNWLEPGAGHRGIVYGHIQENDGFFSPRTGYGNYPVVEVSWYGAAAYCS